MTAPEEEQRWSHLFALLFQGRALLQEAHEWSQAGPRGYHNDGERRIIGMFKWRFGILHKTINDLAGLATAQEGPMTQSNSSAGAWGGGTPGRAPQAHHRRDASPGDPSTLSVSPTLPGDSVVRSLHPHQPGS